MAENSLALRNLTEMQNTFHKAHIYLETLMESLERQGTVDVEPVKYQDVEFEVERKEDEAKLLWETSLDFSFAMDSRSLKYLERLCQSIIHLIEEKKTRRFKKKFWFFRLGKKIDPIDLRGEEIQLEFFKGLEPKVRGLRIQIERYEEAQRRLLPLTTLEKVEACDELEVSEIKWIG